MGGYLAHPVTEKHSSNGLSGTFRWAASEMQGWRTGMEDAHISGASAYGNASVFAVFDGHGGREVAQFCSHNFVPTLENVGDLAVGDALISTFHGLDDQLRKPESAEDLAQWREKEAGTANSTASAAPAPKRRAVNLLQSSIQTDLASARTRGNLSRDEAQNVMMKLMLLKRLQPQLDQEEAAPIPEITDTNKAPSTPADNVGCTAVACVIFPPPSPRVVVANAGDSRCVLSRAGTAFELSHDHKPDQERERSRIEGAGGWVEKITSGPRTHYRVNGNLNLSRALGDLEYKRRLDLKPEEQVISGTPDIIEEPLTPEDEFIVLACDGVWDIMSNQECVSFIRERLQKESLERIVEQILDHCMADDPKATQGLGGDNMTCIIVLIKPDIGHT